LRQALLAPEGVIELSQVVRAVEENTPERFMRDLYLG